MYRRPKFLDVLLQIRESMAREADHDVDLFVEQIRSDSVRSTRQTFTLAERNGKAAKARKSRTTTDKH